MLSFVTHITGHNCCTDKICNWQRSDSDQAHLLLLLSTKHMHEQILKIQNQNSTHIYMKLTAILQQLEDKVSQKLEQINSHKII
jgi:hypothetical protein